MLPNLSQPNRYVTRMTSDIKPREIHTSHLFDKGYDSHSTKNIIQ
jgi:hypothetical protein